MAWAANEAFIVLSAVGTIVSLLPWRSLPGGYNIASCAYMVWAAVACLNACINALVWNHNVKDHAPVWCDISSHIIMATDISISACTLAINRRIYVLASFDCNFKSVVSTVPRAMIEDLLICVGLPILQMIVYVVPQGARYQILEDYGCAPASITTWMSIALVNVPPLTLGLLTTAYCISNIRNIVKRRRRNIAGGYRITYSLYLRLMAISTTGAVLTVACSLWVLASNVPFVSPWTGWKEMHSGLSDVEVFPASIWRARAQVAASVEMQRWFNVVSSFVFFAIFGWTPESKKIFANLLTSIALTSGKTRPEPTRTGGTSFVISRLQPFTAFARELDEAEAGARDKNTISLHPMKNSNDNEDEDGFGSTNGSLLQPAVIRVPGEVFKPKVVGRIRVMGAPSGPRRPPPPLYAP